MSKTYIIAEAGVNHNGSLEIAKEMVTAAKKAGADAVKFQFFKADKIAHSSAPTANYQKQETSDESQQNMLKRYELDYKDFQALKRVCDATDIDFLATPFDLESLDQLLNLDIDKIKIGSGDITFAPLLLRAAWSGKPIILSTGASNLLDIEQALKIISFGYLNPNIEPSSWHQLEEFYNSCKLESLRNKLTLLHCTSEYPAPFKDINLNVLDTFKEEFELNYGYSDHSLGALVSVLAVAKGATIIEKHFTLDKTLEGPDHKASLDINELSDMIRTIRETEIILGSSEKYVTPAEADNQILIRRGIYASQDIPKGTKFRPDNIHCVRPENGVPCSQYWDYIGEAASRKYTKGDKL